MDIKKVGVLGCGLMGAGIAQVCAASGFTTIVREVNETALDSGLARIRKFLEDGVAKGKVSASMRDSTLGNLSGTTVVDPMSDCDIVIEAIVEHLDDKRAMARRGSHDNVHSTIEHGTTVAAFVRGWLLAGQGRRATTTLATNCGSLDSTENPTSRSTSARSSSR